MRVNLAIKLDHHSPEALFAQLADQLEISIEDGTIEAGQMLPSSRELASSLMIARGTVVRAYQILIDKGLVHSAKGKGLSVPASAGVLPNPKIKKLTGAFSDVPTDNLPIEDVTKAAVPAALLPVRHWRELVVKNCRQLGQTYEGDNLGGFGLRRAACKFLKATRGLDCTPEQIAVYTNTDQALDSIARLLIRPNDTAVMEEPGHIGTPRIFAAAGASIITNGIDKQGMSVKTLAGLKSKPKVLYTTPISQDPTGNVTTDERQLQLIDWARRHDCYVIEDGWDTDFWHGRPAALCMQQKAPDQVIYLYSFWKLLFPLSNACFLVVPPKLLPSLHKLRAVLNRPPVSIELSALEDMLVSREIDSLTAKLQKAYRKRRQALIYSLSMAFGRDIRIEPTGGGTHILVTFDLQSTKERILSTASTCGLKIISLDDYYFDGRTTNQYVIFFTNVSPGSIDEQVQRFKDNLQAQAQ